MISTAILTYNHKPYIARAIESALLQSVDCDYEIVVSDDCSTDGTQDIILAFCRQNPERIRPILRDKNSGDSGRTNHVELLSNCNGRYIAYLDGDDYWVSPDKLRKQRDLMEAHPDWSMCFHTVRNQQENGEYQVFYPPWKKAFYTYPELLLYSTFIPSGSVMYRNGLIEQFPRWFHDDRIIGDIACYLLHAQRGNVGFLDEVLGVYRQHANGYWSQRSIKDQLTAATEMCHFLKDHVEPRYIPTLDQRIRRQMACYHRMTGDRQAAARAIRQYIKQSTIDAGLFNRDFILALMTVYCPGLLKMIFNKGIRTRQSGERPHESH